jgi:type IV fimbrial biogenesis protein FimT
MRRPASSLKRGFTLIELMIGLVVLVVLIAIGVPSMQGMVHSSRLSSAANEISGAVQVARAEALRRNRSVVLCRSEDLAACASGDVWTGWLVFVDTDNDGVVDSGEEVLKTSTIDAPLVMRASNGVSSRAHIVGFRPNGLARGANEDALLNATLSVCAPVTSPADNVRDVQISFGSRTSVRSRQTAGDCSAAPSDS